jgi:hypothetical protein
MFLAAPAGWPRNLLSILCRMWVSFLVLFSLLSGSVKIAN